MKILVVAGYAESLINFRGPLLDAMLAAGAEVHAAAPLVEGDELVCQQLKQKGIQFHVIPLQRTGMNPVADLKALISMARLMIRLRPDGVLGYTIKPVIYGLIAARLARVPRQFALITGLGYAFQGDEERRILKRLVQKLYSVALARTYKVFFQNPDDLALFKNQGILGTSPAAVIVNGSGVDIASFNVEPLADTPHFLLVARLLGDKGVREYVSAASKVKEKYPQANFSLVGWIDENPDAIQQQELDSWIANGVVSFHGRLTDVRPAIANSSIYVLPSYREGTPRTVLEAMAMGRPVITTDAPGCRETVVDGFNGFLVPVKAVDELAEAMMRFIESPELIAQMGERSRQIAEERYDVHKVNDVMLREMKIK